MKQWWFIILLIISFPLKADNIFVEAESFDCRGGWVLDNQSMGQDGVSLFVGTWIRGSG